MTEDGNDSRVMTLTQERKDPHLGLGKLQPLVD